MALPSSPDLAQLETFKNLSTHRLYSIQLVNNDFSSLCPVTGQPDSARIEISYMPAQELVETKSLKFYLASFRNFAAFNEVIVNRILDDLVAACDPHSATVRGIFAPRGGIHLTCEAKHPSPDHPRA